MSWSIGLSSRYQRDVGYGVPCTCEHPGCIEEIDRGLSYVCGGMHDGGEHGCGLYFCEKHLQYHPIDVAEDEYVQLCEACRVSTDENSFWFDPKPDHPYWELFKLTNKSWCEWREENELKVKQMRLRRLSVDSKVVWQSIANH